MLAGRDRLARDFKLLPGMDRNLHDLHGRVGQQVVQGVVDFGDAEFAGGAFGLLPVQVIAAGNIQLVLPRMRAGWRR